MENNFLVKALTILKRIDIFVYMFINALRQKYTSITFPSDLPWQMDKSQIIIHKNYDAQIIGESADKKFWLIEFIDYDDSIVEDKLEKWKFKHLPHQVGQGTHFWIVIYQIKNKSRICATTWPLNRYCHQSWQEN